MALMNYTTEVDARKSVAAIQDLLAQAGANGVRVGYDKLKLPSSIRFDIEFMGRMIEYELPCRWQAVEKTLREDKQAWARLVHGGKKYQTVMHFRNVAWRILWDWVKAQLALMSVGMADLQEVMLPYMLNGAGDTTFYEAVRNGKVKLLDVKETRND